MIQSRSFAASQAALRVRMHSQQTAMQMQRQQQMALQALRAVPVEVLQQAADLAGAGSVAAGLGATVDPAATLLQRLRNLPWSERQKLIVALGAAAATVAEDVQRTCETGSRPGVLSCVYLLLALLGVKIALEDSLRK